MKKSAAELRSEQALVGGSLHLYLQLRIAVGKETVLGQTLIPQDLLDIGKRGCGRQMYSAHCCAQVQERGQCFGLLFHQICVARFALGIAYSCGDKWISQPDAVPVSIGEIE